MKKIRGINLAEIVLVVIVIMMLASMFFYDIGASREFVPIPTYEGAHLWL